jgi:hypothetical protein
MYERNKKAIEKRAKKIFGTTKINKETGYILSTGERLKLRAKDNECDHSEVAAIFNQYALPPIRSSKIGKYNTTDPYKKLNKRVCYF